MSNLKTKMMRKLFKDAKKGGMLGYKSRRQLKIAIGASAFMLMIGVLLALTGDLIGISAGVLIATAPILGFTVPEGLSMSETEKKGLEALASHWTKQFNEYEKGKLTNEQMLEKMDAKLTAWAEKEGYSASKIDEMRVALKTQGETLATLKERAVDPTKKANGLKGEFFKQFDELKKAVKDKRSGFVIKAVDEHDPALIHTTDNIISSTTGATLEENMRNNPNLFLRRHDREYIHDIANVSVVEEVPETYTFEEEGDTEGNVAIVAENGLKPQLHFSLIKNKVEAQKAAGYIVVTEEVLKWRSRAWAAILRLFRDKVYRDYENILTTQLSGNATSYISTPLDGTIENPTDFHAIIAAILQLEQLNYQPDTIVINPADKWRLALTTLGTNTLILPYIQQGGTFGLLGLRVITTNKIAAGTFLLGESGTWYIEEERPQLRTGLVNDDLIHNRMTIVGEIFFLHYVPSNHAGAWINGNFATIKEALDSTTP